MLKKIDLLKKIDKDSYKEAIAGLELRLSEAQRICRAEGIPVMIVFEGWSAAGKGSRIGKLISSLDPRGFEVFTMQTPSEEECLYPYMWRFWMHTPAAGRINIFDRSWYRAVLRDTKEGEPSMSDPIRDIISFERQLADAGMVIIKLFLHLSRKSQKKRLRALMKNPQTKWRVTKSDRNQNRNYNKILDHFEQSLQKTDHDRAKWTVIEAEDARFADVKVYQTVVETLEEAVRAAKKRAASSAAVETAAETPPANVPAADAPAADGAQSYTGTRSSVLAGIDLNVEITPDEYRSRLKKAQASLSELHNAMYRQRVPAAIVFEGWDAAGKGGAIKRLVVPLDPRGYEVSPSSAPNDIERAHHYLWRYWNKVPKAGHLTVFDRSWYGRVMVERVEGFCTPQEWRRAFTEINDFEEQLVGSGVALVKFWLHIDSEEQLRRFEGRMNTPEKRWKITDEDWRNREKWDQYIEAVDEMLLRTSTAHAPWTVVEANNKPYARLKVVETVQKKLEKRLNR